MSNITINTEAIKRRKLRLEAKEKTRIEEQNKKNQSVPESEYKTGKFYDEKGKEFGSIAEMFGDMGGLEGEIFRKAAANGGETSFNRICNYLVALSCVRECSRNMAKPI
jgi:hypothetical protein